MFQRTLVVALSVSCLATGAAADGFYAEIDSGASFVADSDISRGGASGTARFDAGFNVGGAVGYRFLERFRAEVNLNYRQADVDEVEALGLKLAGAGDAGVFAAMANGYFDLDFGWPVVPYVGAGIGVGVVDVDSDSSSNVLRVDDTSAEFAWNVMAGLSFEVIEHVNLIGGYRYFSTLDPTLDAELVGFGSVDLDAEVGVHELVFGVRYEF